jgi:hypothetical protein
MMGRTQRPATLSSVSANQTSLPGCTERLPPERQGGERFSQEYEHAGVVLWLRWPDPIGLAKQLKCRGQAGAGAGDDRCTGHARRPRRTSAANSAATRATTGPLTKRGLVVALTYRLRQAIETLPPTEVAALLGELRELVNTYCLRSPRPVA